MIEKYWKYEISLRLLTDQPNRSIEIVDLHGHCAMVMTWRFSPVYAARRDFDLLGLATFEPMRPEGQRDSFSMSKTKFHRHTREV